MSSVCHMVLCIVRRRVTVASRSIKGVARLALKIVSFLSISHDTSEGGLTFIYLGALYVLVWFVLLACVCMGLTWLCVAFAWFCVALRVYLRCLAWLFFRSRA